MREESVQEGTRVVCLHPAARGSKGTIKSVKRTPFGSLLGFTVEDDDGVSGYWTSAGLFELLDETAKAQAAPNGCVCKRCNSANRWAAPNKPDGSYVCFECR
jgi:hypothetical protein